MDIERQVKQILGHAVQVELGDEAAKYPERQVWQFVAVGIGFVLQVRHPGITVAQGRQVF